MCKPADLREFDVTEEPRDPGWFTTRYYTLSFTGRRGMLAEQLTSQSTSFGPDLYDGKHGYFCDRCRTGFSNLGAAYEHVDEEPDHDIHPPWFFPSEKSGRYRGGRLL